MRNVFKKLLIIDKLNHIVNFFYLCDKVGNMSDCKVNTAYETWGGVDWITF
jgi:hypothetical protein